MKRYLKLCLIGIVSTLVVNCHSFEQKLEPTSEKPEIREFPQPSERPSAAAAPNQSGRRQFGYNQRKRGFYRNQGDVFDYPDQNGKELESVVLSIDTGARQESGSIDLNLKKKAFDKIKRAFQELLKLPNNPLRRAQEEYNIKPSLIKFRTAENPSLKVEINSGSILKAVNDMLSSPVVARYADIVARKAADVYTALKDELGEKRGASPLADVRREQ